jgi:hypothetical protein
MDPTLRADTPGSGDYINEIRMARGVKVGFALDSWSLLLFCATKQGEQEDAVRPLLPST